RREPRRACHRPGGPRQRREHNRAREPGAPAPPNCSPCGRCPDLCHAGPAGLVSEGMNAALAPISNTKTILLTTYKRDGTPAANPVSLAFDGERAFFRSYDKACKTRRLRRNPAVQAAPATLRGRPTGPPISARPT